MYEVPKLPSADISSSAVACGNWLAQVRQIFVGLSPTASVWWLSVERAAEAQYHRWLIADPLDRLLLDPASVVADFDMRRFQRVESRAVTLLLAAIPTSLKEEAVSNRWLTTASLLFRVQCVYQPGGSSERSMLLSHLVSPEVVKSFGSAVEMLRKWQQNYHRVKELQAALPDSSLLLRGVDAATSQLLTQNPLLGFRVNSFRSRASLDYNPTVLTVLQLVRLLQAEFEAAALSLEGPPDKRARAAMALAEGTQLGGKGPPMPKAFPKVSLEAQAKALEGLGEPKGKGKGKDKGKDVEKVKGACYNFSGGKGCKYGDSCRFEHDKSTARKEKRCIACGQEGHFRADCPLVPSDSRLSGEPSSPASSPASPKKPPSRPKFPPQAKGIIEEAPGGNPSGGAASSDQSAQEALFAEAAKLLKGVSLKPIRFEGEGAKGPSTEGIDVGWLMSAVTNAADPSFALVDSGATNALRPGDPKELQGCRVIKVDLASGVTELHVNHCGTLLSASPCQVILPAGYLVQLGFTIAWKPKGCVIRRPGQTPLAVTVVKGCPLICREEGLRLLNEYEALKKKGVLIGLKGLNGIEGPTMSGKQARLWLSQRVAEGRLNRQDQITWLRAMFPAVPLEYLSLAAGLDADPNALTPDGVPWNRRCRRAVGRARAGEVLLHVFSGVQRWKVPGIVVEVEKSRGSDLMKDEVFRQLLSWSVSGVVGGVLGGPPCRTVSQCRYAGDEGPPPVRDRGAGRWGLPGLAGHLAALVRDDSVLCLVKVPASAHGGPSGGGWCSMPLSSSVRVDPRGWRASNLY